MKRWLFLICLVFLLTGCGARGTQGTEQSDTHPESGLQQTRPESEAQQTEDEAQKPTEAPTGNTAITLESGSVTTVVDEVGTVILRTTEQVMIVSDADENPRYIQTWQIHSNGQSDEYGNPDVTYSYSLYQLDGTLIRSDSDYYAEQAQGDLLISRQTDSWKALVENPGTGEVLYQGLDQAEVMAGGYIFTFDEEILRVIGPDGNIFSQMDHRVSYARTLGEDTSYILVSNGIDKYEILDVSLKPLTDSSYDSVWMCGRFIIAGTAGGSQVIDSETGKLLMQTENEIDYYDGQCVVLENNNGVDWCSYLADRNGKRLSGDYGYIQHSAPGDYETTLFIASGDDDGTFVLNNKGEIVFSYPNSSASLNRTREDRFLFTWYDEVYGGQRASLLDTSGKQVFSTTDYQWVMLPEMIFYPARCEDYFLGQRQNSQGDYIYDLLDFDGNVILTDLKRVSGLEKEGILCQKGFRQGLLGYDGTWIYQESMFNSLSAD